MSEKDELLLRVSHGNEKAFRDLYYLYYEKLFSFAKWYVSSSEVVEDVVSDVFFNLWKERHAITSIAHFETYLYSAVKNGCLNILKSSYHQRVSLSVDNLNLEAFIEPENSDDKVMYNQLNEALTKAINNLPERCKLIFELAKKDNLKYKEIADILEISPRTVETQVSIATKRIEQELLHFFD